MLPMGTQTVIVMCKYYDVKGVQQQLMSKGSPTTTLWS